MTADKQMIFDPRKHSCSDCVFFVHGTEEADTGFCYRFPPKVDLLVREAAGVATSVPHKAAAKPLTKFQRITSVPQVWHQQFCGEGVLK